MSRGWVGGGGGVTGSPVVSAFLHSKQVGENVHGVLFRRGPQTSETRASDVVHFSGYFRAVSPHRAETVNNKYGSMERSHNAWRCKQALSPSPSTSSLSAFFYLWTRVPLLKTNGICPSAPPPFPPRPLLPP